MPDPQVRIVDAGDGLALALHARGLLRAHHPHHSLRRGARSLFLLLPCCLLLSNRQKNTEVARGEGKQSQNKQTVRETIMWSVPPLWSRKFEN